MKKRDPQQGKGSTTETNSLSEELNLIFLCPFKSPSAVWFLCSAPFALRRWGARGVPAGFVGGSVLPLEAPVLLRRTIHGATTLSYLEVSGEKEAIRFHVFNSILESDRSLVGDSMQAPGEDRDRGFQEARAESYYPSVTGADRCITGESSASLVSGHPHLRPAAASPRPSSSAFLSNLALHGCTASCYRLSG